MAVCHGRCYYAPVLSIIVLLSFVGILLVLFAVAFLFDLKA